VADFGISRVCPPEPDALAKPPGRVTAPLMASRASSCGTLRYMPPSEEISAYGAGEGRSPHASNRKRFARDVYAYALLLHEVLHGALVFGHLSPLDAYFAASMGDRPAIDLTSLPAAYQVLAGLIEQCWHRWSEERPPAQEIVDTLLSLSQHLKAEGKMDDP